MKIRFDYDPNGLLWYGFHIGRERTYRNFDFGLIAFDVFKNLGYSVFYFWRFSIKFFHRKKSKR